MSVRRAVAVPVRRLGQVALWSLLAAGVGLILQEVASRVPFGGRVAAWLLGAAWGLATMFAVPILALEGCTAGTCVKRSAGLMRRRWGEGISGSVSITAWMVLAMLPVFLLFFVAVASPIPAGVKLALAVCLWLAVVAVIAAAGAVGQIFAVALYRYASASEVVGGFAERDLQRPFTPKRRLFRRR